MIQGFSPRQFLTIGQSMGGYAAIMFGFLLGVDKILSFGPLSFLNSRAALSYHDRRWLAVMLELEKNRPPVGYFDLPTLSRTADPRKTALHVFFGTKPDGENTKEAVNLDAVHPERLATYPNCVLHPSPYSGHAVVQYLIDTKQIDSLLAHHIMGVDFDTVLHPSIPSDWLPWIQKNIQLGADRHQLLDTLLAHGFAQEAALAALAEIESRFFHSIR
jgi:hypothetical protein